MSSFLRFTLLGLCVAVGVAIAVCLATSVPGDLAADTALATSAAESAARPIPQVRPSVGAHVDASRTAEPSAAADPDLPREPIEMTPEPAVAQQSTPSKLDTDVMNKMLDVLTNLQGGNGNVQGASGAQQAQGQSTSPTAVKQLPAAQPAEVPPAAAPGPAVPAPPPVEPRSKISTASGDDERLSMNFQGEDIRKVLEMLSEQGGLNILASASVQGTVSANLKEVDIETALDAILKSTGYVWRRDGKFIYVGTPQDFQTMQQANDRVGTRLYRPNYVRASDLQALITPMLTQGIGTVSITKPSEMGIAPNTNDAGGDSFAGQEALLVRDYEAVLNEVDEVVLRMDRRPTQVSIEAMILSVKLNDKNNFGVDFSYLASNGHLRIATGSPLASLAQMDFKEGGLKIGFLDSNVGLFINALETIGDTNVIATPNLMCLNKHRAEILIGEQLGYLSTTQTQTSTTQSIEFLEVGTQLRLRPFISSDGMVRMEVHPELSTGTVNLEEGFTIPNKVITQVTTNIMVRDGSTVIIGGLIRDELSTTAQQVPLLGSLPVVGPVFRKSSETTERREVLVLITPRIVYDEEMCVEGNHDAMEFHHRHAVYADKMNPLGRRYLGRKYFRLAQEAWAEGNRTRALRLVNLSIHFDPISRAAIDLRADVTAGNRFGDHTAPSPALPAVTPLDGDGVPPWLMERFDECGDVDHPVDPGRPGDRYIISKPEARR